MQQPLTCVEICTGVGVRDAVKNLETLTQDKMLKGIFDLPLDLAVRY